MHPHPHKTYLLTPHRLALARFLASPRFQGEEEEVEEEEEEEGELGDWSGVTRV